MLTFIFFVIIVVLLLYLNSKSRRISPTKVDRFIISPIDGFIDAVQDVDIDGTLFTEIIIKFSWYSDRNLFAPLTGNLIVKENSNDRVDIYISKEPSNISPNDTIKLSENVIEVIHYPYGFLSKFNLYSKSFMSLYETKSLISSVNYGFMLYGSHIKIIIHSSYKVVTSLHQNVIGGESILAINRFNTDEYEKNLELPQ